LVEQVDSLPAQGQNLSDPQAGQDRNGDYRPTRFIELLEQSANVSLPVKPPLRLGISFANPKTMSGIIRNKLTTDRRLENRRESSANASQGGSCVTRLS